MNIKGKKVVIRAIEEKDIPFFHEAINSEELEKNEIRVNFPISKIQQMNWYDSLQKDDHTNYKLAIEYNNSLVGYTNILNIDWVNRCAWTGIKIFSTEFRGKGIGTDSVMAIMRFCFDVLNLNRLEGFILDHNDASFRLYVEKCGWVVEGTKRQCAYKNGEYINGKYVSILKEDYYALLNKNKYWD